MFPFPIIFPHTDSWSGDDSTDHTDDQDYDFGSADYTNDHSLDSDIPAVSYVSLMDHDDRSEDWGPDYEDYNADSLDDGGLLNDNFDFSSSWENSFETTSVNDEADIHLDKDNDLEDFDDSDYVNPTEQLLGIVSQRLSYSRRDPRRRYYDPGLVYADGSSSSDSGNYSSYGDSSSDSGNYGSYGDSSSGGDYASSSCTDSDGDGFCDGDD
ncbi:MAG: hypothetical protein F6K17_23030 [Okeania sp. SIO3C4]|nr:hypothetical protein [Okeania sp. SIO3B3]NER05259.1 hypothetical protein [Okeania sp. SIO3C4]